MVCQLLCILSHNLHIVNVVEHPEGDAKGRTRRVTIETLMSEEILERGKVVSCDLNLVYKDRYYTLLGGQDVAKVKGIGTYANMLDINDSIEQDCSYVDFCMEDHHWKSKWFKGTPRYKWVRKPKTIKPVVVLKKKHQKYQRGRGAAFKSL